MLDIVIYELNNKPSRNNLVKATILATNKKTQSAH
jgi:hypothetical protein